MSENILNTIIILNDKDQKNYDYLLSKVSKYEIEKILIRMGDKKPYLSTIFNYAGLQMPDLSEKAKGYTFDDIIIENEKDQQALDYIVSIRGKAGVEAIMKRFFSGGTRPYVSNIAKYGKIELPDTYNKPILGEDRKAILAELASKLKR